MSLVKIDGLNVVTVYVTDLNSALKFYTEFLGFEKVKEMSPGLLLHSKGANLTLYIEPGRELRESAGKKYPQISLCFNAENGVKSALAKLESAGVKIVQNYGDFEGAFAGFQFEDPSGNIHEFAGKP